ncbi:hypothetical protein PC9H_008765 [Pleurotus ostreatus]|uniref:Uncharacterized protein n=2 Tax=Pleurotus TaxID=5320 RepID=A0A8H6ZRR8_PLEOS|nr:uncharacterized protein PC9H_008765 [Pleurotus ostreatus]KAF7426397.1 hypothetical protein PC9H_008765 [Pleurotus ostreatus]KAG9221861.1 hypothetical protein CCMSSC00406_0005686 [Pleurotus cornucopiae]KAJ8693923.1 hypothetical protein PTI98_008866 [Pleurotus ostreatus]
MVSFAKFAVLASCVASGLAASPFFTRQGTYEEVLVAMKAVGGQVGTLHAAIQGFPSPGTLPAGLQIHMNATALVKGLDTWTTTTSTLGQFDAPQCREQLDIVKTFRPEIEGSLTGIVEKKAAIAALPIGGIVNLIKQDLGLLNAATEKFGNTIITACPADMQDEPKETQAKIAEAFKVAIGAYNA